VYVLENIHCVICESTTVFALWLLKNITLQSLPSYEDVKSRVAAKTSVWGLNVLFLLQNP